MTLVPQSRLLFWFAAIALPFATLGALYTDAMVISVALIAVLVGVALVDAVLSLGRLDGVAVELPEVIRFTQDRAANFSMVVRNERQVSLRLRLGLPLPASFRVAQEELVVTLPAGSERSRLDWRCTPSERGNFQVERAYLETSSRLGLWAVRGVVPTRCELRVYPNLAQERRNLAALFLHRGAVGRHAQRQIGQGREFEKLREYVAGDSFDEIHWKATAKRGHPVTKVFQIERTQEIYVVIDASRLSARPALVRTKAPVPVGAGQSGGANPSATLASPGETLEASPTALERFITSALILGAAAQQQGDLFGLVTFADRVENFVRAKSGGAHYTACRDALYALKPRGVTPDFDEIATFLRLRLRRRALLLFLTALDDPVLSESFMRNLDLLRRQHLVLVNMLKPAGADPLFSRPDLRDRDELYEHLGGHLRWQSLRELEKVLQRRGVPFALLDPEQMSAQLVSQYLSVKRRQVL